MTAHHDIPIMLNALREARNTGNVESATHYEARLNWLLERILKASTK